MTITVTKKGYPQSVYVNNHVGYDHDTSVVEVVESEPGNNVNGYVLHKCDSCGYEEVDHGL